MLPSVEPSPAAPPVAHPLLDGVVTHHRNTYASGVARFNDRLARELGVPFVGLRDGKLAGLRRPLLSFKVSELDREARTFVNEYLSTTAAQPELFLHNWTGTDLELQLVERAVMVHAGNLEISARLREHCAKVSVLWTPGLIDDVPPPPPTDVRLFTFGMANKIRTEAFERLRDVLEAGGRSYSLYVSAANHETATLRDSEAVQAKLEAIFPRNLWFLGNLSDLAVVDQLRRCTFFVAFFAGGVRANNTSVAAAMEHGAVVVTNLDEYSPPHLRHLETVVDINSCERLLDDPAQLTALAERARESVRDRGWGELVTTLAAASREVSRG